MANIDTITVLSLNGPVHPLGQVLEEIVRPGVDGHAYREIGKRSLPSELIAVVDAADAEDAQSTIEYLAGQQGKLIGLTLSSGVSFDDVMLVSVQQVAGHAIVAASGGTVSGATYLLTLRIVVQMPYEQVTQEVTP